MEKENIHKMKKKINNKTKTVPINGDDGRNNTKTTIKRNKNAKNRSGEHV